MRGAVLKVLHEYMACETNEAVSELDELDFIDIAMRIEEEHGGRMPQRFSQLSPPPPYATIDALADAVMAYQQQNPEDNL